MEVIISVESEVVGGYTGNLLANICQSCVKMFKIVLFMHYFSDSKLMLQTIFVL